MSATIETTVSKSGEQLRRYYTGANIGRTAITGEKIARNNDPLAHVYLLLEGKGTEDVERQIYTEFITDQGERAKKKHFNRAFNFEVTDNDLISDTGVSLRSLLKSGLEAARQDLQNDSRLLYAAARAEVQASHTDMLIDWYNSDSPDCVMIASLCPDSDELPASTAQLSNFKIDRQMASMWLFERSEGGLRMHAFSLDNLTLSGLQTILNSLGIKEPVSETTIQQMATLTSLPYNKGPQAVEAVRCLHDAELDRQKGGKHFFGIDENEQNSLDANSLVEEKPKAYELYKTAIVEVARSLMNAETTPALSSLASELRAGYGQRHIPAELDLRTGDSLSHSQASSFMEYLRSQAIPEYIYGDARNHSEFRGSESYSGGGYSGISSAGAYASAKGIKYEGACPTSASGGTTANGTAANGQMAESMQVYQNKKKWMSCGFCGARQYGDPCASRLYCGACQGEVINGKVKSYGNRKKDIFDHLGQYWEDLKQKEKIKKAQQALKEKERRQIETSNQPPLK